MKVAFGSLLVAWSLVWLPCNIASAVMLPRHDYESGAGVCQGSLPVSMNKLRARPLGLGNESDTSAFVTCLNQGGGADDTARNMSSYLIHFGNTTSTTITISCTLVHGGGGGPVPADYVVKSMEIFGASNRTMTFRPEDIDAPELRYPQASCVLPPGGVIYYTGVRYIEDVGP